MFYVDEDFHRNHGHRVPKDIIILKNELRKVMGKKIKLIITPSQNEEFSTDVTGVLVGVNNEILKLDLGTKDRCTGKNNFGVYRLIEIIGFVPVENTEFEYGRKRKKSLQRELEKMVNKKIQLITAATPPAGRPPNITGKLIEVKNGLVKLMLQSEHEETSEGRVGVYELEDIIGFVPMMGGDSGCSDEKDKLKDPLTDEFKKVIGKRIEILVASETSADPISVTGTLLEAEEGYIKMELDTKDENGNPKIVVYQTSHIIGFSEKGTPGGGEDKGKVTLQVTVKWPEGVTPREVNVTLIREEVETTVPTINGIATFITDPAGKVIIKGEDIQGFITPIKEIPLRGKTKFVLETLTYVSADISVEGVTLDKNNVTLIEDDTVQLLASIIPPNASNQNVSWESSDENIATVVDGLVTGLEPGTVNITVITEDGGETATAEILVVTISQVVDPAPITALQGELVILPETVTAYLSNGELIELPVVWKLGSQEIGYTYDIPVENAEDVYEFTGYIKGSDDDTDNNKATLIINVDKTLDPAIPVEGITLNINTLSLFVGEDITLEANIIPEDATTKDIIWTSDNENVAKVTDGLVKAIKPGLAVITAETVDGGYKAYCQISVSAVPEIELIYATQEVYENPEDVVINVSNLVAARVPSQTTYHVKVEQKGSDPLLGEGTVTLYPNTTEFNLYEAAPFEVTTNYSNEYFVYMSTDPEYPQGDEMTLMTNFKIDTAVPTIPKENVKVYLSILGGPRENNLGGIPFILARELDDIDSIDTTWRDYAVDDSVPEDELEFTDEVKMIGYTDEYGVVDWEEPRETLKLGGYLLLEVTPEGYSDNLNLLNPESEDGTLIKEVHLTRNGEVVRYIINTYNN